MTFTKRTTELWGCHTKFFAQNQESNFDVPTRGAAAVYVNAEQKAKLGYLKISLGPCMGNTALAGTEKRDG
jgi:hypothetical protein